MENYAATVTCRHRVPSSWGLPDLDAFELVEAESALPSPRATCRRGHHRFWPLGKRVRVAWRLDNRSEEAPGRERERSVARTRERERERVEDEICVRGIEDNICVVGFISFFLLAKYIPAPVGVFICTDHFNKLVHILLVLVFKKPSTNKNVIGVGFNF